MAQKRAGCRCRISGDLHVPEPLRWLIRSQEGLFTCCFARARRCKEWRSPNSGRALGCSACAPWSRQLIYHAHSLSPWRRVERRRVCSGGESRRQSLSAEKVLAARFALGPPGAAGGYRWFASVPSRSGDRMGGRLQWVGRGESALKY